MESIERKRGAWRPANQGEWSLVLAGVNLMLLNFILVQHTTVAFQRAELAVIVCTLAYFAGVSLGYLLSDRLSATLVRRMLPVCLGVQMLLLVSLQPGYYVVARAAAEWAEAHGLPWMLGDALAGTAVFLLVAGFATSIYAVLLPRVIETGGAGLRRCYSLEIAGSLVGLLLVPVLAGVSHEALLAGYFAGLVALAAVTGTGVLATGSMGLGAALFIMGFADWDRAAAKAHYERYYEWENLEPVFAKWTPYHKIEVMRSRGVPRMLLNGKRQFAGDPTGTYAYFVAEYPARLLSSPRVLLLGCGSMATVGRIGDLVPDVRIVDLDAEVFGAARKYFQAYNRLDALRNWSFTADDAKHWLGVSREKFGLILHDIPPARSRQVALTYTDDFFRMVRARLEPGGIFSISSLTPMEGGSHYAKRMLATLASVFEHHWVLLHDGSAYFYGGGTGLKEPTAAELLERVDPAWRADVTVLTRAQIGELTRGEKIVTIANVGDLIYD
jgi:spermidine synthase